jgi:hypothetical protein
MRATLVQAGVLENVSHEAPTEEKDKEMLSSGEDAPLA